MIAQHEGEAVSLAFLDIVGKPLHATIRLDDDGGDKDDDGGNNDWYFDPRPDDNADNRGGVVCLNDT